jgi:hypothetical protein
VRWVYSKQSVGEQKAVTRNGNPTAVKSAEPHLRAVNSMYSHNSQVLHPPWVYFQARCNRRGSTPTNSQRSLEPSLDSTIMFKHIRRSAAVRRKTRRPEVYGVPNPRFEFTSDEFASPVVDSQRSLLSQELASPPGSRLAAKRGVEIVNLAESENVSLLDLDNNVRKFDIDRFPRQRRTLQESKRESNVAKAQRSTCELEEDASPESETMEFVTVRRASAKAPALLLPPIAYQRSQALVLKRQDLRAVESELATTAAKMQNMVAARSGLEEQDDGEVPGAFIDEDEDSYAEREGRRLLMFTIDKKMNLCQQTLDDMEASRVHLEAEFDTLLEQYLDDLERAVRDDLTIDAKLAVWWA